MQWHIITQIGESDSFEPSLKSTEPRLIPTIDKAASSYPISNRIWERLSESGLIVPEHVLDLVHLALAVFTADVRVPRKTTLDQWTRDFILYLPVTTPPVWFDTLPRLTQMLSFLTGDRWEIRLRERQAVTRPRIKPQKLADMVSLFSGGLDSFVGAIDLLESGHTVALVGQYGQGTTKGDQSRAHEVINASYKQQAYPLQFYVQPFKGVGRESEDTMRSRSILFLSLGTAVASALGAHTSLFVPENGLISLNVPLTSARMGSLSTRTTHPHFLSLYQDFINALGIDVVIRTPYRFKTKGEMLKEARNQKVLRTGARQTMSCAHPSAGRYSGFTPGQHCGYCVPCLIRRAAMRVVGLDRKSDYAMDILTEKPDANSVKARDRRGFEMAIQRVRSLRPLELIAEVLHSGPVPATEIQEYAAIYHRGLAEVEDFLYDKQSTP